MACTRIVLVRETSEGGHEAPSGGRFWGASMILKALQKGPLPFLWHRNCGR